MDAAKLRAWGVMVTWSTSSTPESKLRPFYALWALFLAIQHKKVEAFAAHKGREQVLHHMSRAPCVCCPDGAGYSSGGSDSDEEGALFLVPVSTHSQR